MSDFEHLFTSAAGVHWTIRDTEDGFEMRSFQDVAPILEHNKAQAAQNAGWSEDKTFRRAASIPASLQLKWLTEEGWDCMSSDPACQRKLFEKLDSSDYAHLRTAEFRLGLLRGTGAF